MYLSFAQEKNRIPGDEPPSGHTTQKGLELRTREKGEKKEIATATRCRSSPASSKK